MSDEKQRPEWKEVKLQPYKRFVEILEQVREKVVAERDRIEEEIKSREEKD